MYDMEVIVTAFRVHCTLHTYTKPFLSVTKRVKQQTIERGQYLKFQRMNDFLYRLISARLCCVVLFHEWNDKINIILFYLPCAIHPANSIGFPVVDLKMVELMINLNHYLIQTNPKNNFCFRWLAIVIIFIRFLDSYLRFAKLQLVLYIHYTVTYFMWLNKKKKEEKKTFELINLKRTIGSNKEPGKKILFQNTNYWIIQLKILLKWLKLGNFTAKNFKMFAKKRSIQNSN